MSELALAPEVAIFLLRVALIGLLYCFLLALFVAVRRDLRRAATAPSAPGYLVVLDPGGTSYKPGQVLPLQVVTSIGRAPENALPLNDSYVSATHASLTLRNGRWWLRDLESTNGTLVNRRRVEGEVPVEFGDVITVGRTRLKLVRG
jgi:pSer/pThr/pTyr-binding forkhead associated (FHA) protein